MQHRPSPSEGELGEFHPIILCAHCEKMVGIGVDDGFIYWQMPRPYRRKVTPICCVHRRCQQPYEDANPGKWMKAHLDYLLMYFLSWLSRSSDARKWEYTITPTRGLGSDVIVRAWEKQPEPAAE